MELLAQQGVVGAPDEGALVLQARAGPGVRAGGQTGPLQSPVQVPQRVGLQPALPLAVWPDNNGRICKKRFIIQI